MAFNSDTFNDLTQINRSRPSIFGKLWQKTALRLVFVGGSLGFLAVQQPKWWLTNPPLVADSTTTFSGTVTLASLNSGQDQDLSSSGSSGSRVRDEAVRAYIRKALDQGTALADLPEQLALKFQFHKVHLQQRASADGYELRLAVAHFEPIAKIAGTAKLLSRAGAIYASDNPRNLNQLPSLSLPLGERWTKRRTLKVTAEQQQRIDQAMALMATLDAHQIRYSRLTLKRHRGFQVVTDNGLFLQFGHGDFNTSLSRYHKILTREDFSVATVKEVHLDFKGKALITMKPKAEP